MKKVIPSACSLFAITQGLYSDAVDCRRLGQTVSQLLRRQLLERTAAAREKYPGRVFDVAYSSLVADPIATVRDIYHYFGREMSEVMERGMRQWLARHPAHKHGVHRYELEQFGLTSQDIDRDFGAYQERFVNMPSSSGGDHGGKEHKPPPQKV